ncbi:hypothetical protein TNCV_1769301 [Trichonephila clavipes]|nr:hypothetical protein TNCV_1769301 [Trichonephila clavipes]
MVYKGRSSQSSSRNEINNAPEDLIEDNTQIPDTAIKQKKGFLRRRFEIFRNLHEKDQEEVTKQAKYLA